MKMSRKDEAHRIRTILGVLSFLFTVSVFVWLAVSDRILTAIATQVLGPLFALSAGYQASFLSGKMGLSAEWYPIKSFKCSAAGTGGFAVFLVILIWWESPKSPVTVVEKIQKVEIQHEPLRDQPIRDEIKSFQERMRQILDDTTRELLALESKRGSQIDKTPITNA